MTDQPNTSSGKNRALWWLLGGCLVLCLCLSCVAVFGLGGMYAYWQYGEPSRVAEIAATETAWQARGTAVAEKTATLTALVGTLAAEQEEVRGDAPGTAGDAPGTAGDAPGTAVPSLPTATVIALQLDVPAGVATTAIPERAFIDLERLYLAEYPAHDQYDVAVRLGAYDGPRTVVAAPYQIGDTRTFFNDTEIIEATLTAVTEHSYFWVEETLQLDTMAVMAAANQFEEEYYGRLVTLFGSLWQPGVDNDPRFSVLHISRSPGDELGYFDSKDEYPQDLISTSNEQELIYLNMSELELGEDLYYATLVHEVQHLIQWYMDPGETAWMNEGLSQLAEIYLGFMHTAGTIDYLENPHTRLNDWQYGEDVVFMHYAAAYLFAVYIWEQLGEAAVQELARHPANGLAGVRAVLQGHAPELTLKQFTANWAAANYLDNVIPIDEAAADTRYFYHNLDLSRPAIFAQIENGVPYDARESLGQFGVHYIDLNDWRGPATITFAGDTTVALVDARLDEGNIFWFAPAVNAMNAHLTAVYDLSQLSQATLSYSVWYDLEEDYDFAYVSVSTNEGETWEVVRPGHGDRDQYGYAYNGRSIRKSGSAGGWLKESISLNSYVGQPVQIRFDVLTDSGITGQGFAVDNIAVTGSNVATFEDGAANWQAEGFVLTGGWLPQQWSVLLVEQGIVPVVSSLPLNALNQGQWDIEIGKSGAVLVIMPQTDFVETPATYWLNVAP